MLIRHLTFLLPALLFFSHLAAAQESHHDCGTHAPAERPLATEELMRKAGSARIANETFALRIFVYIFANDNGTTQAADEADVRRQIENMRNFYAPHNICFILGGIEVIPNSFLNTMNADNSVQRIMLAAMALDNSFTIFVHNQLSSNDGGLNGSAYSIPNHFLSISRGAISSTTNLSTLTHEFGHCLGLLHTFEDAYGFENVARSGDCRNCTTAGDLICDTQADRDVDGNDINAACEYTGALKLDGCFAIVPMEETNIMTYGRRTCRDHFSTAQGARMVATIITSYSNRTADNTHVVLNGSVTSGVRNYSARNTVSFSPLGNTYTGGGTARINASSRRVTVLPGVQFTPNGGYVHLKTDVLCTP